MAINEGHGEGIFLTWSGNPKDLPKVKAGAAVMRANGTTFRGCSYDGKVYVKDHCPVCGCPGTNPVDLEVFDEERRGPTTAPRAHWQPRKQKAR